MELLLLPMFYLFLLLHSPMVAANPVIFGSLVHIALRQVIKEGLKHCGKKLIHAVTHVNQEESSSQSSASGLQARLRWNNDDLQYVAELAVGTPPRNVWLTVDTMGSFVWIDSGSCIGCFPKRSTPPAYNSDQSTTFITLPCNSPQCQKINNKACTPLCQYKTSYIQGILSNDKFRFQGSADHPSTITFGRNEVDQFNLSSSFGFAGLGRGPLSLISQLAYSKFSYCFSEAFNDSTSGYMFFGSYADLGDAKDVNTTSFFQNLNYYYLDLQGISVGETPLTIPPATFRYAENNRSGTIIDSKSPFTYLVRQAYDVLRNEVITQLDGLSEHKQSTDDYGFDLCFDVVPANATTSLPTMKFHFADASMTLPARNILISNDDGSVICLTIMPSEDNFSILGNFQQQNIQFTYDLQYEKLSFRPLQCNQLEPHKSSAIKFHWGATAFFALLVYCFVLLL